MSTIVTRAGKGSPLTHDEVDANFNNLNTDKAEKTVANTFTANQIVSVTNNTNAALRITQLGTGNALLVEDSTNPDASPFVIDSSGKVIAGYTTPITTSGSFSPLIQSVAAGQTAGFGTSAWLNSTAGGNVIFAKSRSGTIGTFGIVNSGDDLGSVRFDGDDGTQFVRAAQITSQVDGTPGTNDMPGRLVFSTTADGASSPTERMRINNSGQITVGNNLTIFSSTAIPAGGTAGSGYKLSSTVNFGVFFGSGAPTLSAAKGSLYLRSDGTTTNDRMYVNTDGSTTWTAVITAA